MYLAAALVIFGVYMFTLHPTISPYRDSGDLIVSSYTEGIAHPPGYPLYVLSGKIFSGILPWGNAAYRMNVMSAVFGAAAFILLGLAFVRVFGNNPWVIPAVFLLAFAPAYWRRAWLSG